MAKKKLQKFADMEAFERVYQPGWGNTSQEDSNLSGNWRSKVFNNGNPVVLELGCGKGEYAVNLGKAHPDKNYIGVDIKGSRMWRGAKTANEQGLSNVAFLRTRIELINRFFIRDEVDEIWLTFSDPQLKDRRGTKRLSSPIFLKRYRHFLKPGGVVHLKTDSGFLYAYTRGVIDALGCTLLEASDDLYGKNWHHLNEERRAILSVKTFYEKMFIDEGKSIKYIRFQLPQSWY